MSRSLCQSDLAKKDDLPTPTSLLNGATPRPYTTTPREARRRLQSLDCRKQVGGLCNSSPSSSAAQQIDSTSGEGTARHPAHPNNMASDQRPDMLSLLQTLETRDANVDRDLRLLCNKDWSSTSLGPMSSWPQDLLTLIYVAMLSPQPQLFFLGTEQIFLYNTAYGSILRDHHPAYFAEPFATLDRLQPQAGALDQIVKDATEGSRSAVQTDKLTFLDNGGETEEVFLTGTMVKLPPHLPGYHSTLNDTTPSVVTRRRNEFLTALKSSCYPMNDLPALLQSVLRTFSASELDFPFAAVYKVEDQSIKESVLDSPRRDEGDVSLRLAGKPRKTLCWLGGARRQGIVVTVTSANRRSFFQQAIRPFMV
ncbi:putative histidine kinase HHK19p, partial [Aureobasidium melanogenum]